MRKLICLALATLGCVSFSTAAPTLNETTEWSFHNRVPATGMAPLVLGMTEPRTEHFVGTITVPEKPSGWPDSTWILRCKKVWELEAMVGGQNQSNESHYGWERNSCSDPVSSSMNFWTYFFDPSRPEDAPIWQGHLMPWVSHGKIINQWGYTSPLGDNTPLARPSLYDLIQAKENGDTSVYVGKTEAPWAIYTPFTYEWDDWYGLEGGEEINFVIHTNWKSFDKWGFPTTQAHVTAYEIFLDFDLEMEWIEVPQ